jgi:hypothetical protein
MHAKGQQHEAPSPAPSGRRVSLIERWPCEQEACRNHGQMCYWTVADDVENHLPITSVVMQFWLAAIARGESTADQPPQAILERWASQNLRSLHRREERRERREETRKSSTRKSSMRKSSVPEKG